MTLLIAVAAPLVSVIAIVIAGRWLSRVFLAAFGVGPLVVAFAGAVVLAQSFAAGKTSLTAQIGSWLPLRGADLTLRVEPPSAPLLVAIAGVAALVGLAELADLTARSRRALVGLALLGAGS